MKIIEMKILGHGVVQFTFEGTFKEFEELAHIRLENLLSTVEWPINEAPQALREALSRESELRKKLQEKEV